MAVDAARARDRRRRWVRRESAVSVRNTGPPPRTRSPSRSSRSSRSRPCPRPPSRQRRPRARRRSRRPARRPSWHRRPRSRWIPPSTGDGNLTALAQGHGHHDSAATPVEHTGSAVDVVSTTGSADGSGEIADPRTHPDIAPESPDCDEASCILDRYQRECCARYKPAEAPAAPAGPPVTLDKAAVIAGIDELKPAVQQCGDQHHTKGTVKITLTVSGDGHVAGATVADAPDPTLGQCVANVLERAAFPTTQNGAVFTYPFVF